MHRKLLSTVVFYSGSLYLYGLKITFFFLTDAGGQGGETGDSVKCMVYVLLYLAARQRQDARCAFA